MLRRTAAAVLILASILFAQQEAGEYDRKSITYIHRLLELDNSIRSLPAEYNTLLVESAGRELALPRYDYNHLPEKLIEPFRIEAAAAEQRCVGDRSACLYEITGILSRTVTPPIMSVVEMNRDIRAQDRMTEQQRNSFITDKAKELGFTEDEVKRVMNAAYIFMPFGSGFIEKTWRDTIFYTDTILKAGKIALKVTRRIKEIKEYYSCGMKMGLVWWKIIPGKPGDPCGLEMFAPLTDSSSQVVEMKSTYTLKSQKVSPIVYARTKMVESLGNGFGQRLRDFDDFRLTGQILNRSPNYVDIDLGTREGLAVDDIFWVIENIQQGNSFEKRKAGWISVRTPADSSSKRGYRSKAQIMAGRPYLGAELQELPMSSSVTNIRFSTVPYTSKTKSDSASILQNFTVNSGFGAKLELGGHIGHRHRISQLYLLAGAGFSLGDASGSLVGWDTAWSAVKKDSIEKITRFDIHKISGTAAGHYDLSLMKRFNIKRVGIGVQTGGGYQHFRYILDNQAGRVSDSLKYRLVSGGWGGFSNLFAEIAVSPTLSVGGGAGYRYFGEHSRFRYQSRKKNDENSKWQEERKVVGAPEVNYRGTLFSLYMHFRPAVKLR